jgi:hypothetical protein
MRKFLLLLLLPVTTFAQKDFITATAKYQTKLFNRVTDTYSPSTDAVVATIPNGEKLYCFALHGREGNEFWLRAIYNG